MGLQLVGFPFTVCAFFLGGFFAIWLLGLSQINDPLTSKSPTDASVSLFSQALQKVVSERRLRVSALFPMGMVFISQSIDCQFLVKWTFLSLFTWLLHFVVVAIDPCQYQVSEFLALSSPFAAVFTLFSCILGSLAVSIFFTPYPDKKSPFLYEFSLKTRAKIFFGAVSRNRNTSLTIASRVFLSIVIFVVVDTLTQATAPLVFHQLQWPLPNPSVHTAAFYPPTPNIFNGLYTSDFNVNVEDLIYFVEIRVVRGVIITALFISLMVLWSLSQRTLIGIFATAVTNYCVLMNSMQAYWLSLQAGALLAFISLVYFGLYGYLVYLLFQRGISALVQIDPRGNQPPTDQNTIKTRHDSNRRKKRD